MEWMRKVISLLFVLCLWGTFSFIQTAMALSCAPPSTLRDEFMSSSIVFMGTAFNSNTEAKVDFLVKKIWKGNTDDIQEGVFVSNMWMEIKEGQDYLLFVNKRDGQFAANICGNSKLWSVVNSEQINENLGAEHTMDEPGWEEKKQYDRNWKILVLSGAFITIIGIVLVRRYRSRQQN